MIPHQPAVSRGLGSCGIFSNVKGRDYNSKKRGGPVSLQEEIIATLGVKPVIDTDAEIRKRVDFLKAYALQAGARVC